MCQLTSVRDKPKRLLFEPQRHKEHKEKQEKSGKFRKIKFSYSSFLTIHFYPELRLSTFWRFSKTLVIFSMPFSQGQRITTSVLTLTFAASCRQSGTALSIKTMVLLMKIIGGGLGTIKNYSFGRERLEANRNFYLQTKYQECPETSVIQITTVTNVYNINFCKQGGILK